MLDENFARDQIFRPKQLFFTFFLIFLSFVKPIRHLIQHGVFVMLDECWIGLVHLNKNLQKNPRMKYLYLRGYNVTFTEIKSL